MGWPEPVGEGGWPHARRGPGAGSPRRVPAHPAPTRGSALWPAARSPHPPRKPGLCPSPRPPPGRWRRLYFCSDFLPDTRHLAAATRHSTARGDVLLLLLLLLELLPPAI